MTYCVGSDIAAFAKSEGLDLSAIPAPEEVDAAWCLGFLRAIRDVFYIEEAEGEYFDLGQSPIFRKPFTLGESGGETTMGTFLITDACIGCGTCTAKCPEHCIAPGEPYVINQSHCLRCGICQEACPAQAIAKNAAMS